MIYLEIIYSGDDTSEDDLPVNGLSVDYVSVADLDDISVDDLDDLCVDDLPDVCSIAPDLRCFHRCVVPPPGETSSTDEPGGLPGGTTEGVDRARRDATRNKEAFPEFPADIPGMIWPPTLGGTMVMCRAGVKLVGSSIDWSHSFVRGHKKATEDYLICVPCR